MKRKRARKKSLRRDGEKPKNRHAAAMGRKGARSTNAKLTPEQRVESARRAARARWRTTVTTTAGTLDHFEVSANN